MHVLFTALLLFAGCGNDSAEPSVVRPVFAGSCRNFDCSHQGVCVHGSPTDAPVCVCDDGYGGEHCQGCAAGFHRDAWDRCLPDERCADEPADPCGIHGRCTDESGIVACDCDPGHEGTRCELCAAGYARDPFGDCLQRVLSDGRPVTVPAECSEDACHGHGQCSEVGNEIECSCYPGYSGARCDACADGYTSSGDRCIVGTVCAVSDCGGCVLFDGSTDFPAHPDTCTSRAELQVEGMLLWSTGGEGAVWLCAQSTLHGLTTEHVMLEAGAVLPAEITFIRPIAALSFDYAAADAFAVELLGDDVPVETLSAERRTQGSLTLEFDPPISLLAFRSSNEYSQSIAIDNLQFEPAICR